MKRNGCAACVGLLSLVLSSVGGCRPDATKATDADNAEAIPAPVTTLAPTQTSWTHATTQPATVHAYYHASVFSRVPGYVAELKADIGQRVKQGDVLAIIDVPELAQQREAKLAGIVRLEAEERRAVAQLAVAAATVDSYAAKFEQAKAEVSKATAMFTAADVETGRVTDLVQQRAVADRLLDESRQKLQSAQAATNAAQAAVTSAGAELTLVRAQADADQAHVDVAKAMTNVARRELDELDERIKFARISAPFDGMIIARNIDPGELVSGASSGAGDDARSLFVVAQLDRVRVRVPIPEREAPLAGVGDEAEVRLQSLADQRLTGRISRVSGALDEQTRTMMVEIDLPNPDGTLLPGMFGQATIELEPPRDKLTLPANTVRYDAAGSSYVYVVNSSSEVAVVAVGTGLDDGQQIEITDGLAANQLVIGPLLRRLKVGQKVKLIP